MATTKVDDSHADADSNGSKDTQSGLRQRWTGSTSSTSVISSSSKEQQPQKNLDDDDDDTKNKELRMTNSFNYEHREKSLLEKLFSSKEEKTLVIPHLHKILGFSCLGSFIYRLSNIGRQDGNFGPHWGTIAFIALHLSVNLSAFIFAIPQRRIRDGGYRIWPEYRFHSLVFASRSLAFMLLLWYEQMNGIHATSRNCYHFMDFLLVLATCAAADYGSSLQGPHRSNTVREATFSDPFENWFASEMQLILTAFCLVGYRRYTIHLMALFNIQVNAFLMTLRRKNVASQNVLTFCYTLMLIISALALCKDDRFYRRTLVAATFGSVAAILRMGPLRLNKYILWTFLALVYNYIRISRYYNPSTITSIIGYYSFYNDWFWLKAFCVTKLVSSLLGAYQRSKEPKERRSTVVGLFFFVVHAAMYGYLFYYNVIRSYY